MPLRSWSISVIKTLVGRPSHLSCVSVLNRSPVPQDYDDLLSYYTKRGYRVIAMAGKSIEGLTWLKAQKLKRCGLYALVGRRSHY